jgi:hypothetical protein
MTTYYVDNITGNNGDSGLTPADAWLTITYAVANVTAGDVVRIINTGTAYTDSFTMTIDGTSASPITMRPNDYDDPPIISMAATWELDSDWWIIDGLLYDDWGNITAITFGGSSIGRFNTVSNSHFRHNDAPAIKFADAFSCVVEDCWFSDIRERIAGDDLNSLQWDDGDSDACIVRRCNFEDIGSDGIQLNPNVKHIVKRALIEDCAFWVNRPYAATTRSWQDFSTNVSENGVDVKLIYDGNDLEMRRCLVYGFLPTVAGQDASGSSGEGLYIHNRSDSVAVEQCTIHECERGVSVTPSGGFSTCGATVRNSLVVDCIEYSIRFNDAEEICIIENNTVIASTPADYFTLEGTTDVLSIKNNYIQGGDYTRDVTITGESNFDYNAWDSVDSGPPAQWVGANDPAIVTADLDGEYRPGASSDLLAAGIRTGRIRDLRFDARPDPFSVGCYEENIDQLLLNLDCLSMYRWYDAISDTDHEIFIVPGAESNLWRYAIYIKDTTAHYLEYDFTAQKTLRNAFYVEPSNLIMASGDEFVIAQMLDNATEAAAIELHYDGSNYRVAAYIKDDSAVSQYAGAASTGFSLGDNDRHLIEMELSYADNPGDNDGYINLYIDGAFVGTATGINNDTLEPDKFRFGAVSGLDAGTGDTENFNAVFFMDNIRISSGAALGSTSFSMPPIALIDRVKVVTHREAANTALGFQDITASNLDGLIPEAALVIMTNALTDGTPATHAIFCYGAATHPGYQWATCATSESAVGTTDVSRIGKDGSLIVRLDPGSTAIADEAEFFAFISEGIRIDWTNAPASAYLITVVFFAGEDVSKLAHIFEPSNSLNGTVDVQTPLFEPDVLLTECPGTSFSGTGGSAHAVSLGASINDGSDTQSFWTWTALHGVPESQQLALITELYATGQKSTTGVIWGGEIDDYDEFGYSCISRIAGGGGDEVGCLALAFNNQSNFYLDTVDTPTSTGNQAYTGMGFTPQAAIIGVTHMPLLDTDYADGNAGSLGIGVLDENNQYCNSNQDEDAADPTDTQSLSDNVAVNLPNDDASAGHIASLVSFDTDGLTLNFTTTEGTAVKYWLLAIGEVETKIPPKAYYYRRRTT